MGVLLHDETGRPSELATTLHPITRTFIALVERLAEKTGGEIASGATALDVTRINEVLPIWYELVLTQLRDHVNAELLLSADDSQIKATVDCDRRRVIFEMQPSVTLTASMMAMSPHFLDSFTLNVLAFEPSD